MSWLTAAVVLGEARDAAWRRAVISEQLERLEAMQMPWFAAQAKVQLAALPQEGDLEADSSKRRRRAQRSGAEQSPSN